MILSRILEAVIAQAANLAWRVCTAAARLSPVASFQPAWAAAPLPESWEKGSPVLGWPRTPASLCPTCVKDARARILSGVDDLEILRSSHVGEIKASILERDGKILIEKTCPRQRRFTG